MTSRLFIPTIPKPHKNVVRFRLGLAFMLVGFVIIFFSLSHNEFFGYAGGLLFVLGYVFSFWPSYSRKKKE